MTIISLFKSFWFQKPALFVWKFLFNFSKFFAGIRYEIIAIDNHQPITKSSLVLWNRAHGRIRTADEGGPSPSREPCPGMLKSFPFSNKSRILLSGCNLLITGIYSAANSSKVEFLKGYKVESGPRNFAFILYRPTSCFHRFKTVRSQC